MDDGNALDLKSSYLELELDLNIEGGNRNVVLGRSGVQYNSSAIVRTAKMHEPKTAKIYQDLVYVNLLSNNLTRYSEGVNKVASDSLWGGSGKVDSASTSVFSVFNNTYPDPKPVLKVPLCYLYPGSLGSSESFKVQEDLRFQFLLEPQYNIFQRAVKQGVYNVKTSTTPPAVAVPVNAVANNGALVAFTTTNAGTVLSIPDGTTVNITYTLGGVVSTATRRVISHTADIPAGANGAFTIESSITGNVADSLTAITFTAVSYDLYSTSCADITASSTTLTFLTPFPVNQDIYKGTTLNVAYKRYNGGNVASFAYVKRTVSDIAVTNNAITMVTFSEAINPTNENWTQIHLEPLYTNLDNNWTLSDAHLILYKKSGVETNPNKMMLSTFQSVNYAMIGGLDKSFYTVKAPINTFNALALLPSNDNMISVCSDPNETGSVSEYRIYVNELQLTSIYDPVNSAIHEDNLIRVLNNSSEYKAQNLRQNRDTSILTTKLPDVVVGKLFSSVVFNAPNVEDFNIQDSNLKLELTGGASGTPQKNVYCFMEMWKMV